MDERSIYLKVCAASVTDCANGFHNDNVFVSACRQMIALKSFIGGLQTPADTQVGYCCLTADHKLAAAAYPVFYIELDLNKSMTFNLKPTIYIPDVNSFRNAHVFIY